jgi:hypothetical protein
MSCITTPGHACGHCFETWSLPDTWTSACASFELWAPAKPSTCGDVITTIAAAVCALALGLFFNWLLKRRRHLEPGGEPITTSDLTSPMETLAVLLLAFVLVVAAESYSAADEAVRSEAVVVEHLFEYAEFAPEPAAQTLQGVTVCYTRAVLAHEWAQMEEGSGLSPVPSVPVHPVPVAHPGRRPAVRGRDQRVDRGVALDRGLHHRGLRRPVRRGHAPVRPDG